jgi:hypothetical protein
MLAFSLTTTGFGFLADGVFPAALGCLGAETDLFGLVALADFCGDFFPAFFTADFLTVFFVAFLVVFFTVFLAFFTVRLLVFARFFDAAALVARARGDLRAFFALCVLEVLLEVFFEVFFEVFLEAFFFGDATTNSFTAQTTFLN